jgi:hypothetical protein
MSHTYSFPLFISLFLGNWRWKLLFYSKIKLQNKLSFLFILFSLKQIRLKIKNQKRENCHTKGEDGGGSKKCQKGSGSI